MSDASIQTLNGAKIVSISEAGDAERLAFVNIQCVAAVDADAICPGPESGSGPRDPTSEEATSGRWSQGAAGIYPGPHRGLHFPWKGGIYRNLQEILVQREDNQLLQCKIEGGRGVFLSVREEDWALGSPWIQFSCFGVKRRDICSSPTHFLFLLTKRSVFPGSCAADSHSLRDALLLCESSLCRTVQVKVSVQLYLRRDGAPVWMHVCSNTLDGRARKTCNAAKQYEYQFHSF